MDWNPEKIKKIDPDDMYARIYNFPEQLFEGYNLQINNDLSPLKGASFRNIVIAGMGGSAIGGDLLRSYVADQINLPIFINRNYSLPRYVDESTLFIASSYSGNTEETLAAFDEARNRKCKIFVMTTGGKLGQETISAGYPYVTLPAGLQPRAALGYSFGPLLRFMEQLAFIPGQQQIVEETCNFLKASRKKLAMNVAERNNQAKQLALKFKDKFPIVYAGADYYDTVAIRFKGQICENSKQLSFANIAPEFNHNEIVGYDFPQKLLSKLIVIFLSGPGDSKGVTNRFKIINSIIKGKKIATIQITAKGPNRLAEIFSLIQLGDLASYYLAIINKTDPSPVKVINRLKTALEKTKK